MWFPRLMRGGMVFPVLLLAAACGADGVPSVPPPPPVTPPPPPPPTDVPVVAEVGTTGGTFTLTTAGDPYRGTRLTVPAGTFPGTARWEFRTIPAPSLPTLPAGYRVLGPALQVTTEAAPGAHLMTLDIPVPPHPGEAVVIALQDPARHVLEVMPTVEETDSSIRVMTTHLRGDLILGPATRAGLVSVRFGSVANMLPIVVSLPQPPAGPLFDLLHMRWPVLDHGTSLFPDGLGAGISALQVVANGLGNVALGSVTPQLSTPGFYAESGPLAAAMQANTIMEQSSGIFGQLESALDQLSKPVRDDLVHRNVLAGMALSSLPQIVSIGKGIAASRIFADVTAATQNDMTLVIPSQASTAVMSRSASAGFGTLLAKLAADVPPIGVDEVVPLSSFTAPFDQIGALVGQLGVLANSTGAAREAANKQLATIAGLTAPAIEQQTTDGGPWLPVGADPLVARGSVLNIRLPSILGSGKGLVLSVPTSGAEVARTSGGLLDLGGIADFTALGNLITHALVASPFEQIGGLLRQIAVAPFTVVKAPFMISPRTPKLDHGNQSLSFTASTNYPPSEGYRIQWDWGDGMTSENFSLNSATHTYAVAKEYQVVATMVTATTREKLASDTVNIMVDAVPDWQLTSFVDQDALFEDNSGGGPIGALLERLIAAPRSGILAIDSLGPGASALRIHVNTGGLWDPSTCCTGLGGSLLELGALPPVQYPMGPYFSGYDATTWSQTTTALDQGSITGQVVLGTVSYDIPNVGVQTGPAGVIRISATRSDTLMTGSLRVSLWFTVDETGKLAGQEDYRFPFTAVRVR